MTVEQMLMVNKRMQKAKKNRESPETTKTQKINNKTIHSQITEDFVIADKQFFGLINQ